MDTWAEDMAGAMLALYTSGELTLDGLRDEIAEGLRQVACDCFMADERVRPELAADASPCGDRDCDCEVPA